jgi:MYXO-CTERM domain-containing protein
LILPTVAYAAGPFYTTTDPNASLTASGLTPGDPRRAATTQELAAACQAFGAQLGSGEAAIVYWYEVYGGSFCQFSLTTDGICTPGGCFNGRPPGTGVDLPPPLIIGGLIALGLLLLGTAWLLRRRTLRPT